MCPEPPKKLGGYLVCSSAVKQQAEDKKESTESKRIGDILLDTGSISRDELELALRKQRVDRLRQCPVFGMLTNTELFAISNRFSEISFDSGEQFIFQDEPDPILYILATGKVEVYRTTLDGQHIHIAYVEPPEPIGEMGYFQGGIRNASVRAVDDIQLLKADYANLTHYFEYVPRVAHEFMKIIEQRRYATEQILQNISA